MRKALSKKLLLTAGAVAVAGLFAFSQHNASQAQNAEFSPEQREALGKAIKEFLMDNPEVIFESIEAYREKEEKLQAEQAQNAIKDNIARLTGADEPSLGPVDADVTIVEFFDYNCGYCKRAIPDIRAITAKDKKVRFVFKEMPILGPTSVTAAKWAMAAHKQDRYFDYHAALMEHRGPKEEGQLMKIAERLGLDADKMKKDAGSQSVQKMIDDDIDLARAIGINGTPAFIVGETLYPGYIGEDGLLEAIKKERSN